MMEYYSLHIVCSLIIVAYLFAVQRSNQRYTRWPFHRTICFIIGMIAILFSISGPIAKLAHENFIYHMIVHLLLGMLAPLLLVISAPMTLLLRNVSVEIARKISRFFRSRFVRFYRNPVIASTLNIGGLWLLYTTPLFMWTVQYW